MKAFTGAEQLLISLSVIGVSIKCYIRYVKVSWRLHINRVNWAQYGTLRNTTSKGN